jgi:hypothetical protein
MTLGTLKQTLKFIAIDMPEAFNVMLGNAWLKHTKAKLDFGDKTCTVRKGKRIHIVHMQQDCEHTDDTNEPALAPVLSYASAKRCLQQSGVAYCLVLVRPNETDGPQQTSSASQPQELPNEVDQHAARLHAEFPEVFTDKPPHGGSKMQLGFEIIPIPPGSNPVLKPMYRYSPIEMEEMEKQIKTLLELGYIRPSQSPYGAPVLFVKKPRSTELRMLN